MSKSKTKQTIVISGATKGLGKALALKFAAAGCNVVGLYHSDETAAKDIETEFRTKNFSGVFIRQNIAQEGKWTEFDEVISKNKNSELTLIANASPPFVPKPLHLIDAAEFSALFDVNVKGTFSLVRRLLPLMIKNGGTIIGVLSSALGSPLPPKGFGAYVAAKSALEGLTKSIAAEYSVRGIRVFSVSPGLMRTALTNNWGEHLKSLIESPDGNLAEPSATAAQILSLSQNANIPAAGENYLLGSEDFLPPNSVTAMTPRVAAQS